MPGCAAGAPGGFVFPLGAVQGGAEKQVLCEDRERSQPAVMLLLGRAALGAASKHKHSHSKASFLLCLR